jgi:hydrogenase nickel incorporation protein HypA/HybF
MHEHALVANLIRQVDKIAAAEGARRVTRISVWLGALSHMSPEHFRVHFDQDAAGSIAEGAALDCAVSDDIADPNAMDVLIKDVEVET